MDESLFAKYAPVKLIGITGTRGKSTTTSLIYKIMQAAHLPVWLGGNVVGLATLPLLQKVKENDWVVLELSSWQLQGFEEAKISPHIAAITNIYEDHLNRYESMKDYINDKKNIFKYQGSKDYLVLNEEAVLLREMAAEAKSQIHWFNKSNVPQTWQLKLKGEHNKSNVAAATKVAEILGISQQVCQKVCEQFAGLPYRLETIATINGIEYVNDTTSTTPAAGVAAINSFRKPIVLIAGGNSKNLNIDPFAKIIVQKTKKIVLLEGTETGNLERLLQLYGGQDKIVGKFDDLKQAVAKAKDLAHSGDVILFSPGCTSFGMFKNEFDRGDKFNQIVKSLT
jgi:UDP-N-acetylmuramoylalanine--D-glutamate ligase